MSARRKDKITEDNWLATAFFKDNFFKIVTVMFYVYGFLYASEHYDAFDISVVNIYSIDEYLLVFLPLLNVLLPLFLVLFVSIGLVYVLSNDEILQPKLLDSRLKPERLKVLTSNKRSKSKRLLSLYYLLVNTTTLSIVVIIKVHMELKGLVNHNAKSLVLQPFYFAAFTFSIYSLFIAYKEVKPNFKLVVSNVLVVLILIVSVGYIKNFGRHTANESLKGKTQISFCYEGSKISSDNDHVLIGNTRNFLVIRDIRDSSNLFFERDKVTELKIKVIKK
jgi:hypothetical protein